MPIFYRLQKISEKGENRAFCFRLERFPSGTGGNISQRGKLMSEGRKSRGLPPKICWVTYGLQGLSTEKFLKVVQKILEGKLVLLKPPEIGIEDSEPIEECFVTREEINLEDPEIIEECFLTQI